MVTLKWPHKRLLHIEYAGDLDGDQLMESAMEIAGDERFDYVDFVLGDWAHYRRSSVSQEDVKALVAVMKPACLIRPKVKNATVIRPDRSGNALVAFYKMLADDLPWDYDIFHSFDEAYAWFGIPTPDYHKNVVLTTPPESNPSPVRHTPDTSRAN